MEDIIAGAVLAATSFYVLVHVNLYLFGGI